MALSNLPQKHLGAKSVVPADWNSNGLYELPRESNSIGWNIREGLRTAIYWLDKDLGIKQGLGLTEEGSGGKVHAKKIPSGCRETHRIFFEKLSKAMGIRTASDWYKVSKKDVFNHGGKHITEQYYGGSLSTVCLSSVFSQRFQA